MRNKILFLCSFPVVHSQIVGNTAAAGIKEERPLTQQACHGGFWGRTGMVAEKCERAFQAKGVYV